MKKSNPNRVVTLGELKRRPELLAELRDDPELRQVFANVAGTLQAFQNHMHEQARRWHESTRRLGSIKFTPGPGVQAGLKFLEILESAKEDPTIKQSSEVVDIIVLYASLFKNVSLRDLVIRKQSFAQ